MLFLTWKMPEKDRNLEDYFESSEFNSALKTISKYKQVDQERLNYNLQKIKGLPPETFTKVCNAVFSSLESKIVEDKASSFGKYHLDYKGVRFHLMIGQGSSYWTEKLK